MVISPQKSDNLFIAEVVWAGGGRVPDPGGHPHRPPQHQDPLLQEKEEGKGRPQTVSK